MSDWPERQERVYHWDGPPAVDLWRARVTLPTGLSYTAHRLITGGGRRGVAILAQHGGQLLLVRTSRPAADEVLYELPRGFGEQVSRSDRAAIADAERELREETGLAATSAKVLGEYITDTSLLPSRVAVVRCGVVDATASGQTDGEADGFEWVQMGDIRSLIAAGRLHDAHSLSALAFIASEWA